jgi:hypothetical protein
MKEKRSQILAFLMIDFGHWSNRESTWFDRIVRVRRNIGSRWANV